MNAIESALRDKPYYCKSTSSKLALILSHKTNNQPTRRTSGLFSKKELDIIQLICEEKTSQEISNLLYLSMRTIEGYRSKIAEKMGVKTSVGIALYAIRNGFFQSE